MSRRFIGGLRIFLDAEPGAKPDLWPWPRSRYRNATRPCAELLIDDDRGSVVLRLRGKWLRRYYRYLDRVSGNAWEWSARLDSVTAERFGNWEMTRGVVLRSPGQPPAIFWCSDEIQDEVLGALPNRSIQPIL